MGTLGEMKIPSNLLQKLQSCRTLPSVPGVVLDVLELSQDPDVSIVEIAKTVSRDPALVAKILKVANSPWAGVRRQVTSLGQAVNLLGTNGTMSIALSFSLVRGLQKTTDPTFDHQAYWRRSAISATATLSVGIYIKAAKPEELFLSGLLHDIGILVLSEAVATYSRLFASCRGNHDLLVETERKELGTDHAQVGSWFLERWGLPTRLLSAIPTSHEKEGIADPLAKAVAIGSRTAEIWMNPETVAATAAAAEAAHNLLGLSVGQFNDILEKTAAALPETTRNLEISIGDESSINELLDQAREAILELNIRTLQEAQQFAVQAQRDALTSLYNRTYLDQALGVQFDLSRKLAQPLTAIFIDIDHFKQINDTYGHPTGDSVLVSVARLIESATRTDDTIVRYGGDEFVVLLSNTDEDIGAKIAERIRLRVEEQPHSTGDDTRIPITVSVGWATMSTKSKIPDATELLAVADRSLYLAKTSGRNQVARTV